MNGEDLKVLRLVPGTPYSAHMVVEVFDFPKGTDATALGVSEAELPVRRRCSVDVEYGDYEIKNLRKVLAEKELDWNEGNILDYYKDWIYTLVKTLISSDWKAESGLEEVMTVVKEKIAEYI